MRKINKIIIHCSATPEGRDVKTASIKRWHTSPKPKGRGWSDLGYHFVIELDGSVIEGRPLKRIGAHVKGHNSDSIGICYVGGMDKYMDNPKDTRTDNQKIALKAIVKTLKAVYPNATIHGHNEFSNKACPSFDVSKEDWTY